MHGTEIIPLNMVVLFTAHLYTQQSDDVSEYAYVCLSKTTGTSRMFAVAWRRTNDNCSVAYSDWLNLRMTSNNGQCV